MKKCPTPHDNNSLGEYEREKIVPYNRVEMSRLSSLAPGKGLSLDKSQIGCRWFVEVASFWY
jgi:hypothetical protein